MKSKILITTSSFPINDKDSDGIFVNKLAMCFIDDCETFILAPYAIGYQRKETRNNINILRYKYWVGKKLLGDGEIMANLKQNKWMYLQVFPFLLFQFFAIFKTVKKEKIQVIHAHWLIPQAFLAVLYKKIFNKKIKILGTIHGGDINIFGGFFGKKILRFIFNNIDELTVVSNAIKKTVLDLGYEKEVYVYPMGVDTVLFSPDKKEPKIKEKYNIKGNFILFVGGIIYRKGIDLLIKAMPAVIVKYPDTKLIAVGSGNIEKQMIDLCEKLNVTDNVIFTGKIMHANLPAYFATADIFILPSQSEGFGLVVAEAISAGTLTIATNIRPVNDIIIEGKTGFYLPELSSKAIAEKVIDIINTKNKYNGIKLEGRKHIVQNFDWKIVANNYINLFNKLIYSE